MRAAFVDSSAWIALVNRRDPAWRKTDAMFRELARVGARLMTTNYVVAETATRLRYDVGLEGALAFRDALARAARLHVRWVDPRIEGEAWDLMKRHADVRLSLTDAVSAVVARRARITEILTLDADFRALGFEVRLTD